MNRRSLLQLALLAGCARKIDHRSDSRSAWMALGREFGEVEPEQQAWAVEELRRMAGLVEERTSQSAGDWVRSVQQVVFEDCKFVREVHDTSLRFVLLPSVLRLRRGSCVGLGTLLLALAELAGQEAHGVVRPGHFYVRFRTHGNARNLEPLREGEQLSDAWYAQRFPVVGDVAYYARDLTPTEVLGILEYNIGNERKRERRWSKARDAFARATQHFPEFAEAHASLGSVLHVLGSLGDAERAYRRALSKNPMLPGLEWNLELLHLERAGSG